MATKKKGKKTKKSKHTASKKVTTTKRAAKKALPKKVAAKKRGVTRARKAPGPSRPSRKKTARRSSTGKSAAFELGTGSRSAGQAGDLQGLRDIQGADSESVDELLEEGNAFEADVVAGVEHAGDNEEREVHTHEVAEDDVPEEYLDKD